MEQVHIEVRGHVALMTLDRPEALNALNTAFMAEIAAGVDAVAAMPDVRVLVITGTGKSFIAGADIGEMLSLGPVEMLSWVRLGSELNVKLEALAVPVIAAVNGFALGGGCELAMACDLRVASEKAKFGQPETGLGVTPGAGGTQRLPRLVGVSRAKELLFTGRIITAAEALQIGLVDRVVPPEELMDVVMDLARAIAQNAPVAVQQCKRLVNAGTQTELTTALALEQQAFCLCNATEDKKIGMSAFLNKQTEKEFTGR